MEKVLSKNNTLVAAIGGLRFGEYLIFPIERANTVKVTCSFYGLLWRKRFRTKVNRYARTITVTRVSDTCTAGTRKELSEQQIKPLKFESMNTTRTKETNVTNGTKVTDGTKVTNGTKVTKVTKGTNGTKVTKGKDGAKVPNEAKGKKHRKSVKIDLDKLIHQSKLQYELLQAVYNALANTYLRNLEERYEGDYWFVKCEGTDIITNELGDIIRKSDGAVIAKAKGFFAIAAAYSAEVFIRGGTAEKIYISQ